MKKAILFDIDGTLLDAWDFIFDSVKNSIKVHNLPELQDENIRQALGKPLAKFYEILFPGIDPVALAQTHREFQENNFHLIKPFANTKTTLKQLKNNGFLMAAVSNRMRASLIESLKQTKTLDYFQIVVSADDVQNPKPHKEHLLTALDYLKVEVGNAYMVGDTDQDILAGKNAKVKTVGVTYGFAGKDIKNYNPDFVIDDIAELLKILKTS